MSQIGPSVPRWLPSPAVLHGIVVTALLAFVSVTKGLVDPDYYWHVTAGRLMVERGSVPSTDPFSFTWQGQPWTPHEWLSEVVMHLLVSSLGPGLTLLLFGAIAGLAVLVLEVTLARSGVPSIAVVLPATLVAVAIAPYVTARPQIISWLLLALELVLLMTQTSDRPRRVLLLVPFFAIWANLHGLYVVGLGVLALFVVFTVIRRTRAGNRAWAIGALAGCTVASMATPAGPAGILYPLRYIDTSDWGLANIAEWQSPNFHDPVNLGFLVLILAIAFSGGRRTPGWLATLGIGGAALGLVAVRNVPLTALLAFPMLAFALDGWIPERHSRNRRSSSRSALGRRLIEGTLAAVVIVAGMLIFVPPNLDQAVAAAAHDKFPVEAVDRLTERAPDARVVVEYGWAGYVIGRLFDLGGRVFIDGRNDMYPESLLEEYSAVRNANPGWQATLDRYHAEWLLFPPAAPIVKGPAADAGWCDVYRDSRQVLMERC